MEKSPDGYCLYKISLYTQSLKGKLYTLFTHSYAYYSQCRAFLLEVCQSQKFTQSPFL